MILEGIALHQQYHLKINLKAPPIHTLMTPSTPWAECRGNFWWSRPISKISPHMDFVRTCSGTLGWRCTWWDCASRLSQRRTGESKGWPAWWAIMYNNLEFYERFVMGFRVLLRWLRVKYPKCSRNILKLKKTLMISTQVMGTAGITSPIGSPPARQRQPQRH